MSERKPCEVVNLIDVVLAKYGVDSVQYKQHRQHVIEHTMHKKPELNAMQKMLAEMQGRKIK